MVVIKVLSFLPCIYDYSSASIIKFIATVTPIPFSDIRPNLLKQHLTPYHLPDALKPHCVDRDCALQEFITETLSVEFKRGHTYYEFINEIENILEGKEVLLQYKKTEKWFRLALPEKVAAGKLKLYGEGIARSSFGDQYRVFIQSFGSGARHLPHGSWILYNCSEDQVAPYNSMSIFCNNFDDNCYDRWSLMSFHWCLFAWSISLTNLLTQRKGVHLKNSVYKMG